MLIAMAMPAMTVKAANRLPRTPHLGRTIPNTLPKLNLFAISGFPRYAPLGADAFRQYRARRLTNTGNYSDAAEFSCISAFHHAAFNGVEMIVPGVPIHL
jgi:hypothetical protein